MSITKEKTQALIKNYSTSNDNKDTGSVEVQCAIMTERITNLTGHMNASKKDFQARRGLLVLVNKRRKLLRYLERENAARYQQLITKLGIRK
ncbi:MAG: 30S ribosomal protein S15 [Rickettsiales bacterium]